jgi:hypothetical protein
MPILSYTTKVAPKRTASEIQGLLASKGAQRVSIDYDKQGEPTAVEFMIAIHEQPVHFRLPCNVDGVQRALLQSKLHHSRQTTEHARSVAWRIVKTWVEAQLAIVESNQAEMAEVFLPYAIDAQGESMYELFKESKQKQLGAGGGA